MQASNSKYGSVFYTLVQSKQFCFAYFKVLSLASHIRIMSFGSVTSYLNVMSLHPDMVHLKFFVEYSSINLCDVTNFCIFNTNSVFA